MAEPVSEPDFRAFVALDWADQQHVFAVADAATGQRDRGALDHTPEAVRAWAAALIARCGPGPIAVGLEQSRGALTALLLAYDCFVVYPVPPQAVAKMRQAFYSSRAKDDPRDADLLLDILLHHRRHLRPLRPDTAEIRLLQLLVADRRRLVDEKTRQKNRLTDRLKQYYPQALGWFDALDSPLALDFLERWPTLAEAQRARPAALRKFFAKHGGRNRERNEKRIAEIRGATPLTTDPALVESGRTMTLTLTALMRGLLGGIAALQQRIEQLTAAHQDYALFASLPGAAQALAPRLLAAWGSRRERFSSAAEAAGWTGIAPVRKQSGKQESIQVRWACPKFPRQSFHEFAAFSIRKSVWARAYYEQQRERGSEHHAAVRALAYKWIRILYRCWQDRQPYDEARYLAALRRRGSPLVDRLPAVEIA